MPQSISGKNLVDGVALSRKRFWQIGAALFLVLTLSVLVAKVSGLVFLAATGIGGFLIWGLRFQSKNRQDKSERPYRQLIDAAGDVFFQLDQHGRWSLLNPAWEELTGFDPAETLGEPWHLSIYADDRTAALALLDSLCSGAMQQNAAELRVRTAAGSFRWVEVFLRSGGNDGKELLGTLRNITTRKLSQEALRENEERYRRIFGNIQDVYFETSMGGVIVEVSPSVQQLAGFRRDQLVGRSLHSLGAEKEQVDDILKKIVSQKQLRDCELKVKHRDGELVYCSVNVTLATDSSDKPLKILGSIRDVSDRKKAEQEIRQLAYHDTLTGLPNRSLFNDRLDQALAQAERHGRFLGLLFLDLDRFKDVNDTLGHASGDLLLKTVGERLNRCVRQSDTVARFGGDEFVVLLTSLESGREAALVAGKVLEMLAQPAEVAGQEVFTSTSIGIVMYPHDGRDSETLLKHADMAMYAAKEQGRNNYQFFSADMNRQAMERSVLERRLRIALEKQEFALVYQPQWDMRNRRLLGVEALVRWHHPKDGVISPAKFIPVAEETGLIRPLGEWVLRTACQQMQVWHDAGFRDLIVGVNLSARQFRQPDLVSVIDRAIADSRLPAECLELELTESYLMEDAKATARTLEFLKVRGIKLAIDDFGTGYSSLSYLKNFPIDRIKIDQSFVRDITSSRDDAAIVEAIIAMAHSLELQVVAEGVETTEQLKFLQGHGCCEMQGYLFARPMPPEQLTAYLNQSRERRRHGLHGAPEAHVAKSALSLANGQV